MEEPRADSLRRFTVDGVHGGERLDRFLVESLDDFSRAGIQRLISGGRVKLNGAGVKAHHKVRPGDEVEVEFPPPGDPGVAAEDIPLDIIYEDDDLLVVNKGAGMIVHPAGRIVSGTLVNALLARCPNLSGVGGILKPGIVHRLDKGTSGCLLVAKGDAAHRALSGQFARREVGKEYLAILIGALPDEKGVIKWLIARHPVHRKRMAVRADRGREAVTSFEVRERLGRFTFVSVNLKTGRTHQIRVHMSHLGYPVFGDDLYRGRKPRGIEGFRAARPMLHAWKLSFTHPRTGTRVHFRAPLPEDFTMVLEFLRREVSKVMRDEGRGTRDEDTPISHIRPTSERA